MKFLDTRRKLGLRSCGIFSLALSSVVACGDDGGDENSMDTTSSSSTTDSVDSTSSQTTSATDTSSTTSTATATDSTGTDTNSSQSSDSSTASTGTSSETGTDSLDCSAADSCTGADPLLAELCQWSEKCCDDGEFAAIFGMSIGDAAQCTARMKDMLHDNDEQGLAPYQLALIHPLLSDVADSVNLARSLVIEDGVQACVAALQSRVCNVPDDAQARCETPTQDPCELTSLFAGRLPVNSECSRYFRGPWRDIECVAGTSCEDTDPSTSLADFRCVAKGRLEEPCEPHEGAGAGDC